MSRTSSAACGNVEKWMIYVLEVHMGSYNAAPSCMHDTIGFTQLSCDDVLKFDQNCQISGSRSISLISQKLPGWFFIWPRTRLFCNLKAFMLWFKCCASSCFVWLRGFWQVVSLSVYCDSVVSEVSCGYIFRAKKTTSILHCCVLLCAVLFTMVSTAKLPFQVPLNKGYFCMSKWSLS